MENEALYLSIINNLTDGVYYVDRRRHILFWNKAAEEISGYTAAEIVGKNCGDNLLNHIDSSGNPLCVVGCPLYATMEDGLQRREEVFLRHKEGHRIPVLVNIFPIYSEGGEITGAVEVFSPNSPTVYSDDLVEQLSNMAMRDALTGLPNRRYLESFLDYKMKEHRRFRTPFSVLFLDIDNFRNFNNEYGHDTGDLVLKKVAETIRQSTRKSDMFGRWGGEEFVGIYSIKNPTDSMIVGEKVRMLVENTIIPYESGELFVTASIGITNFSPEDSQKSILERADQLMYTSKERGKNRVTSD